MIKNIIPLLLLVVLVSCSATPLPRHNPASDPVIVPRDFFGMVHAGMRANDQEYKLLDEMGVEWLLQTFYWSGIEKEKGVYDFSGYDNFVNTAVQRGKKVFATVAYSSQWIEDEIGKAKYVPERYILDYLNFVEALVSHFKGKIHAYQIWNEPNWIMFWKGTDKEFYNLSKLTAQRIRETYPQAYIIGGGILRVPKGFINGLNKTGALENIDAFSFHPYALNPEGSMRLHDKFNRIISEIDFKGEIWVSEIGFPSGGWYPTKASMKNFPSYIVKTITGIAARGTRALFWYQLYDHYNFNEAPNTADSENYFGLVYPDYSRKNGSWAYELCARYLPGSRFYPDLPARENIPSGIVSFCFLNETANTLILWDDTGSRRKYKLSLSSDFSIYDISTGNKTDYSNEIIIDITDKPLFITWKGSAAPRLSR